MESGDQPEALIFWRKATPVPILVKNNPESASVALIPTCRKLFFDTIRKQLMIDTLKENSKTLIYKLV
jgi:hypothetical protein